MAFRVDEEIKAGFERAFNYLLPQGATAKQRAQVKEKLEEIVSKFGPVIENYPSWHPFLLESDPHEWSPGTPNNCPSFKGLDHTIYFANAILTCPYKYGVEELIQSVNNLKHPAAMLRAVKLNDVVLFNEEAVPILIMCYWHFTEMESDGTVPSRTAIGLMLEREIPNWKTAKYCESWENMRRQMLGAPHGARSSLFINQQTGQQMKNLWNQLIKTGVLGMPR